MELTCDVLVVGGGCGGVAAALTATDLGRSVILTEVGSWIGGQLTSQAVPPDEHPWVESTGTTARYRRLRASVRARYKQTRRLTVTARRDLYFNPARPGRSPHHRIYLVNPTGTHPLATPNSPRQSGAPPEILPQPS